MLFVVVLALESRIIRQVFFGAKGVPSPVNQRNTFKSLLMSFLIMKQSKSGHTNKYGIDNAKFI